MPKVMGAFDVKTTPLPADTDVDTGGFGRLSLDKRFYGALDAESHGQMVAFRSAVAGSAGYVAMELVRGTLDGHAGSFVLQHSGTMNRGAQALQLSVVPDSGTDALTGLAGTMQIIMDGTQHSYDFEYTIPS